MSEFKLSSYRIYFDSVFKYKDIGNAYFNYLLSQKNTTNFSFLRKYYEIENFTFNESLYYEIKKLDSLEKDKEEAYNNIMKYLEKCAKNEEKIDNDEIKDILENIVYIIRKELINDSFPIFIRVSSNKKLFQK